MWVGVLSDTLEGVHPEIFTLFEGLDFILHCGGIGNFQILNDLSNLSPISGVLGNEDSPDEYPFEEVLFREMAGVNVLVAHEVGTPAKPQDRIQALLKLHQPKVVLFGRSKEPFNATVDERLWLNPGSASPQGRKGSSSAGLLEIDGQSVRGEIVYLTT